MTDQVSPKFRAVPRNAWIAILSALLAGWLIRVAVIYAVRDVPAVFDERWYLIWGRVLADGRLMLPLWRPPLYPMFMAVVHLAAAPMVGADGVALCARVVQAALGTVTAVGLYGLARAGGYEQRSALAAGACALFLPTLVGFNVLLWSETLYAALLVSALLLFIRFATTRRSATVAAAGMVWGLGILTREAGLYLWVIIPVWYGRWYAQRFRDTMCAAIIFLLGLVAVVAPWSVRNIAVYGRIVPVATNAQFNLLMGADPETYGVPRDSIYNERLANAYVASATDPVARERWALRRALEFMAAAPAAYGASALFNVAHVFTLDSFVLRHLREGVWGDIGRGWMRVIMVASIASTLAVMVLAVLGSAFSPPRAFISLLLMALGVHVALYGVTFSLARFQAPLLALFLIPAGWAAMHWRDIADDLGRNRATAYAVIALVALSGCWTLDIPLFVDMWETGGSHFRHVILR